MNRIFTFFLLLMAGHLYAQREDNVWTIGDFGGLDFNTTIPVPVQNGMNTLNKPGAAICDASGALLFYTNGYQIFNRNHLLMPHGDSTIFYTEPPGQGNGNYLKRPAITPVPGSTHKYYVFTASTYNYPGVGLVGALLYSIVDMNLDGGLGDVVSGQKRILLDTAGTCDGEGWCNTTDIKHLAIAPGDNCSNVWLVNSSSYVSYTKDSLVHYRAYEITPAGIHTTPVVSSFPAPFYPGGTYQVNMGKMIFSPDGTHMACSHNIDDMSWSGRSWIDLLHFDPVTGIFSDLKRLGTAPVAQAPGGTCYYISLCFSPDNSKLYAGTGVGVGSSPWYGLFQFDVTLSTVAAIDASKAYIAPPGTWDMKLGPDGKIYITKAWGYQSLDRINFPNLAGAAAGYTFNAVSLLPATANIAVTTFSNYVSKAHIVALDTVRTAKDICMRAGDSTVLQVDTGFNYTWIDGDTGRRRVVSHAGLYIAGRQFHCTWFADTFRIINYPDAPVADDHTCPGQGRGRAYIHPQPGDATLFTYTWKDEHANILRQRDSKTGDSITGLNPGHYLLQITTPAGCDTSYAMEIQPYEASQPAFSSDSAVCKGDTVYFTNQSAGFVSWSWYFGDGDASSDFNTRHIYRSPGDYTAMLVTASEHCSDTARKIVSIHELALSLTTDHPWVKYHDAIQLTSEAPEHYSVLLWEPQWLFADQQAYIQTLTADSGRKYLVVGISDLGCIDTASTEVSVDPVAIIPNAFSPNGDGLNDRFLPAYTGDRINVTAFQVFNRWGQLVWDGRGTEATKGWDGTYHDKPADVGTYYWYIEIKTLSGKTDKRKGDLTLIR